MTIIRIWPENEIEHAPCIAEYVMACLFPEPRPLSKFPASTHALIRSLRESATCDVGNGLYDPSRYNLEVTAMKEGPGGYQKPEIEIHVEMTKKGNLSVKWYPLGHFTPGALETDENGHVTNSSFSYFVEEGDNWLRPPNELLYLQSFQWHYRIISNRVVHGDRSGSNISDVLVYASKVAITSLLERLQAQFTVKVVSNLFVLVDNYMEVFRLSTACLMGNDAFEAQRQKERELREYENFGKKSV